MAAEQIPGFDETLFEEMRRLTPEQRLELNDRTIAMIMELRRAFGVADAEVDGGQANEGPLPLSTAAGPREALRRLRGE